MYRPIVAIIGRPNVGKSSLFNRLLRRRHAIVSPVAGTTRDRLYAVAQIGTQEIDIIDTAGLDQDLENEIFGPEMLDQVQLAVQEADLLIFVLDAQAGLTHDDQVLAEIIRKAGTPTVVYINKVDNDDLKDDALTIELGLGPTILGSLAQRRGADELIETLIPIVTDVIENASDEEKASRESIGNLPRVALIGRPNVGKSSLFNALSDDERVIVSDIPGTTRDTIDSKVEIEDGQSFVVTDTAGLRRRGKVGLEDKIERYSIMRTMRAIDEAKLVILVVDAQEGLTRGDVHAVMHAQEQNKRFITVFNKADLVDPRAVNTYRFPFISRGKMLFVSAKERVAIDQLHELIQEYLKMPDLDDAQSENAEI